MIQTKRMTPIIKPVGNFCNQKCTYCFYYNNNQGKIPILNDELLEKFIREYIDIFTGKLSFIWHGGEPLLAGIDFYRKVINFQSKHIKEGRQITNHIQTNATLINNEWACFFRDHNFKVGVSLDGDMANHDICRITKTGQGTFDRVMKGLRILNNHNIKYGVIQVLTKHHLDRIKESFDYFSDVLKLTQWSVNAFVDTEDSQRQERIGISNKEYMSAFSKLFSMWLLKDDENLKIREIENSIYGVLGRVSGHCTFSGTCSSYFCLNHDGRIYPCDSMTEKAELCFGNLTKHSLSEILNSLKRKQYVDTIERVNQACAICEWYDVCHNGCTSQRVGGIDGKYFFCESRREMFEHAKDIILNCSQISPLGVGQEDKQ